MDTGQQKKLHRGKEKWKQGERERGVDGGNLACETVGIREQETAGCAGQSASALVKNNSHMCCNVHFLTDLKQIAWSAVSKTYGLSFIETN